MPDLRTLPAGAALLAAFLVAPGPAPAVAQPGDAASVRVVATTGMIADAARQIAGDLYGNGIEIRGLMGAGIDPHGYRQTRSDIVALTQADLVLWNGLYLEAQMERFLIDLGARTSVVAVGEAVPDELLIEDEEYEGRADPHVWMVPTLWTHAVTAVRDALVEAAPEFEATLQANAQTYLAQLDALDAYAAGVLASVPAESRVLVTAHDAFGYFGKAYGFEVLGIQGISTESEAGLSRIGELVDMLVERDIRAVFVETSVADRNVRALIEGAAARGHEVAIGGELFSDAMGEDGSYEGTYIGMIDHNVTTIARALGGEAPERGMSGRLGAGS
jgi:manganese/zinc/iron transport system substrate-binding protein